MATPPITELFVAAADVAAKTAEAAGLPKIAINKVSCEWLQILAEGWASPMTGFMREKEFLKCIHFNQIDGVNQSVPIVLPINAEDKASIAGAAKITLTYEGKDMAIMNAPEVYDHVKEERAARTFGESTAMSSRRPKSAPSSGWVVVEGEKEGGRGAGACPILLRVGGRCRGQG